MAYPETTDELLEWFGILSGDCEPDYHPAWANYEFLERQGTCTPEELAVARKAAELEGHRQFAKPDKNPA